MDLESFFYIFGYTLKNHFLILAIENLPNLLQPKIKN
jgi:hypothetical protein